MSDELKSLGERANRALAGGDAEEAARVYQALAHTAAGRGERAHEARAHYALSRLAATAGRLGQADDAIRRAEAAAHKAKGDVPDAELLALVRSAAIEVAVRRGRSAQALRRWEAWWDVASERSLTPDQRYAAFKQRAMLHVALEQPHQARAAMEVAEEAAREGTPALALRARLERRAMANALEEEAPRDFAAFIDIEREAMDAGVDGVAGEAALAQAVAAFRSEALAAGRTAADRARKHALSHRDPLTYLLASILLAQERERAGDRVGVLQVLLRAKASVERAFGQGMGQPIVAVLDGLRDIWGHAEMGRVRLAYRRWVEANPPG